MWSCFADPQPSSTFQYFHYLIMRCWALLFISGTAKQPWPIQGPIYFQGPAWQHGEPEHRQHLLSRRWFLFPHPSIILGVESCAGCAPHLRYQDAKWFAQMSAFLSSSSFWGGAERVWERLGFCYRPGSGYILSTNCKYVNTPFLNPVNMAWTNTGIAMNSKHKMLGLWKCYVELIT